MGEWVELWVGSGPLMHRIRRLHVEISEGRISEVVHAHPTSSLARYQWKAMDWTQWRLCNIQRCEFVALKFRSLHSNSVFPYIRSSCIMC